MFDAVRDQVQSFLAGHRQCVIIASDGRATAALLAHYQARGLDADCLLPLWAELTYCLEADPRVTLIIGSGEGDEGSWMQVQGVAEMLAAPAWDALLPASRMAASPMDVFRVVRVRPHRIDLMDERRGWGARETLELG